MNFERQEFVLCPWLWSCNGCNFYIQSSYAISTGQFSDLVNDTLMVTIPLQAIIVFEIS